MARNFNGSSRVLLNPGALPGPDAAFTWVAVFRVTTGATVQAPLGYNANSQGYSIRVDGSDALVALFASIARTPATSIPITTNKWYLVAISKPATNSAFRFNAYQYDTDTWTRANTSATAVGISNPVTAAMIGDRATTSTNPFFGDVAAAAIFSAQLSDDQIDSLPHSLNSWISLKPAGMWVLDQQATSQKVLDWTGGGAGESSLVGTTVSTASVPILGYGHPVILSTREAPAGGGGGSAAPNGLAVPVTLGTPTVSATLTAAPNGLAVPVGVGQPTVSIPSASPSGLAVPVALGQPTVTTTLTTAPTGLTVPVSLGTPSVTTTLTAVPDGLAVPVAFGSPSVVAGVAAPNGVAVPVAFGQPTVTTTLTASPTGLSVPVSLGTPSVTGATLTPNGLAVPVVFGTPIVTIPAITVSGIAVPVTLGSPAVSATTEVLPPEGAQYEIEEIMDALAATFNGLQAGYTIGGTTVTIGCYAEVTGAVDVPAVVLELDDQEFDLNMGHGADSLTIIALVLVQYAELEQAQRELWRFLSRNSGDGITRLKGALEANQTLGGLVSYAIMRAVRNIGQVNYGNVEYLGAEIVIEVVS